MPNWCDNKITFTGAKDCIHNLITDIQAPVKLMHTKGWLTVLSFDQPPWEYGEEFKSDLLPGECVMSRTLGNSVDKYNFEYQDMIDMLGTKWDFSLNSITASDSKITGYASTAWSPPEGWFLKVCNRYTVSGELSSGERGNDFGCILEVTANKAVYYASTYYEWECLNVDSVEEFVEEIIGGEDEYPEFQDSIIKASKDWPKTWDEYKSRFYERTTQI